MVKIEKEVLRDIYPKEWKDLNDDRHLDILEFRNIQHYKNYLKPLSLKSTSFGMNYNTCLKDLLKNVPIYDIGNYEIVKNTVKQNLLKRGLISENVYESYKYSVDGEIVDVSRVINGDPECFLTPNTTYKNYFYELYINFSINGGTSNETIAHNLCKILATVELLEKEHIYCKITAVDYSAYVSYEDEGRDLLLIVPIFSHKDFKDIKIMSSILNERFLRCFSFAISEHIYGDRLSSGYGKAKTMPNSIRPINIDEIELASSIIDKVVVGGTR